jgi:signal transduction histidine kinase
LERFVKLEGSRTGPGTGLGLSLVAAVAKLHGAVLRLGDNDPGLEVEIRCRAATTTVGETPD